MTRQRDGPKVKPEETLDTLRKLLSEAGINDDAFGIADVDVIPLVKYLLLDNEAFRRENKYLKKLLQERK